MPKSPSPRRTYGPVLKAEQARQRFKNASVHGYSGAMGVSDRGYGNALPLLTDNPYSSNDYFYRWRQYVQLYETSWEARKIIRIVPEDALRKAWEIENVPVEMAKGIKARLDQIQFLPTLKRSLILERLLGGCLSFMGVEDMMDAPDRPYRADLGMRLRFINAIPLHHISRVEWCQDPLSERYMRPEAYWVAGQVVHASRCLVWDGEPLFDTNDFALQNLNTNIAGFGPSKLAPIWDDIIKAIGTRQAAYQLIQTNNAIIAAVSDLQDMMGTGAGKTALQRIKDVANQLSLYRAALLDAEKVTLSQHSASFGSVPELLITYLQVLSAASDIPATRFLGQAPGGLNATGESDLENYYNVIDAYQRQRLEPQLRRVYDVVGYELYRGQWGKVRREMEFKFPPLWNETELEQGQRTQLLIDNLLKLLDANVITEEKAIEELNAQSVFSVELDVEDLELLEDAAAPADMQGGVPGQMQQQVMNKGSEFDESKIKRADDGKFGSGGGASKKDKPEKQEAPAKQADGKEKENPAPIQHTPEDAAAHAKAKERGIKVPPAWTDLWVSDDPNAKLQAKGKDSKGREQPVYLASFREAQDIKKFARVQKFSQQLPRLREQLEKDSDSKPEAAVIKLMLETGFRPGGEGDTGAEKQAYGATTLTTEHVSVDNGTVTFDFTGKKGVQQNHSVDDPSVVKLISKAMEGKGPGEKLFDTNDEKVRRYMKKVAPGFKPKDCRTHVGTATALQAMSGMEKPTDARSLDKAIMAVCKHVSKKLGNTPAVVRASYINPMVWKQWEV